MRLKLPRFVHGYSDRHGRARYYIRRVGFKAVPLPGLPHTTEFMDAYHAALAGKGVEVGSSHVRPGTIRFLAVSYYNSLAFRSMKANSQRVRRNIVDRFCEEQDSLGRKQGDKMLATLLPQHIVRLMAARADKPESANGLRKALRAMMQHAVETGLRSDDPTANVKRIKSRGDGFHVWSATERAAFEAKHPIGSRARLAYTMGVCTGQRRGDLAVMGRQHIRDGVIFVRQEKTGRELSIPVHPDLADAIAKTPSGHMTLLTTANGKPFSSAGLGNWFRSVCDEAGLKNCSLHGLRKVAAQMLAECGCSVHEIASITGHQSLREVERYAKGADQVRLARAAMAKMKTGTSIG